MARPSKKACVLISGGMDSAVLLGKALERYEAVYPLFIRCGLIWERAELHWLKRFLGAVRQPRLKPLTVLSFPIADIYGSHWSLTGKLVPGSRSEDREVYLPGRNLLFLSKAAVFCSCKGIETVLIGVLKGNPFPDSTPAFFRGMEKICRSALRFSLSIQAPFLRLVKDQVLRLGARLPLHFTFSCLSPRGTRPCGRCNKCAERKKIYLPDKPLLAP
jgi:7-cyano-7-deazaguanine synthase